MGSPAFIGIDWGSTNARAMLFDAGGGLLETREFPLGVKNVAPGTFRASFERMTAGWPARGGELPAFLSGMVGSRHGWIEVPYLPCPARLTELARALVPVPGLTRVSIVPGLMMRGERHDVLRGEELQVLGLGAAAADFAFVCIPGTHAKWIVCDRAGVRSFETAMTGEVFAATVEHTLFAQLIPREPPSAPLREAAFATGLERSAAPHGLLHALFELRAERLLGQVAAEDLSDRLSGLLIGTEIRHAQTRAVRGARVAVIGATGVGERYLRALRTFGFDPVAFDPVEVAARGFAELFRQSVT